MSAGAEASQREFVVRTAVEADRKAIRMLLPDMQASALCVVATGGDRQLVVGAAAAAPKLRVRPVVGPGVDVEVIAPYRRLRVATALLAHLESAVRDSQRAALALYAAKRVERGSEKASAWARLGFSPLETVEEHQLPTAGFEAQLGPLVERMRLKGKIPSAAEIIPLYRANLAEVLQLHLNEMGGDRGELYRKLRGEGTGAFHPRYSRVLLVDGKVKGCILAHRISANVAQVDANILDPGVRGGWANVWLKLEATRCAVNLGVKTFQFTSFDHYTDTRSFTTRLGGITTRAMQLFYRPIGIPVAGE